jgi:hypothetical protein
MIRLPVGTEGSYTTPNLIPSQEMGFLQREELLKDSEKSQMDYDGSFDLGGNASDDSEWDSDMEMDVDESGFNTLPPGEEAFLQSHAGGEAIFQKIWDRAEHRYYMTFHSSENQLHFSIFTGEEILGLAGAASRSK